MGRRGWVVRLFPGHTSGGQRACPAGVMVEMAMALTGWAAADKTVAEMARIKVVHTQQPWEAGQPCNRAAAAAIPTHHNNLRIT